MPNANGNDGGHIQDAEKDKEKDFERDREKSIKNKQSSKAKDLSHVPCKFFKVGGCTAGSSCPFSHNLQEPGAQREACAWYVKGNCKFGHKCALAHILPGQSMAMDRKNKKAAQVAANAGASGKDGGKGGRGHKRDMNLHAGTAGSPSAPNNQMRNPLLPGSTAPTRVLPSSSRPPLSMPISPSAPAPPLKDTDFASFGLPDESTQLSVAPAHGKASQPEPLVTSLETPDTEKVITTHDIQVDPTSPPLPLSAPSVPRRLGMSQQLSPDFGPIGSPPRSVGSIGQSVHINGLSPSTPPSQKTGFLSSSPFSGRGTHSVFLNDPSSNFKAHTGIASSLGTNRTRNTDFVAVPSQVTNRVALGSKFFGEDIAVDNGDMQDFLPSSLTDLLTPEERSRRMSRSNSGQPMTTVKRDSSTHRSNIDGLHHRYSRSVPASSLLGDLRSIWSDNTTDPSAATGGLPFAISGGGLGVGTPNSYKSGSGFGNQPFNEDVTSPPLLSPSNASAAFLPGLHHHYLNSKLGSQRPTAMNPRSAGTTGPSSSNSGGGTPSALSANPLIPTGSTCVGVSTSQINTFGTRPRFENATPDSFSNSISNRQVPGRPIPGGNAEFGGGASERENALSPSTRALQSHAPGQSLPQGLAAGYSRIHALPPPPMISSSSGSSAFSPGQASLFSTTGKDGNEWPGNIGTGEYPSGMQVAGTPTLNTGLDSMFARLSYPVITTRASSSPSSNPSAPPIVSGHAQASSTVGPLSIVRNISARSWPNQGAFSPLGGPTVPEDDDELFRMDG